MTSLRISLILILLSSCGSKGILFDPHFYVPSVQKQALVDSNGAEIDFLSEDVRQYGCMHKSKIQELRALLRKATVPKSSRSLVSPVESTLSSLLNQIDKQKD